MTTSIIRALAPADIKEPGKDDDRFWSVTTIIGALDKPAIPYWAAEQTAIAAIDDEAIWKAMLQRDRDEAQKWLRDARFRPQRSLLSSADLGAVVHSVCEHYALSGEKPDLDFISAEISRKAARHTDIGAEAALVATMLDRFDEWCERFQPEALAAEMTVYHPDYGYAGQLDAILRVDLQDGGGPVTFTTDYKSTREPLDSQGKPRKPYPEQVGLQLAAYRNARFAAIKFRARRYEQFRRRYYALNADERALAVPIPPTDTGLVIHISPLACEAFPIECDEFVFSFFLHCLECFRWVQEIAPRVMGDPLIEGLGGGLS